MTINSHSKKFISRKRQSDGLSMVELMVAIVILTILALVSLRTFALSSNALKEARARSTVNALIEADQEKIRNILFTWKLNETLYSQGLTYYGNRPDDPVDPALALNCSSNDLGSQIIADNLTGLETSTTLDLSSSTTSIPLDGISIARTIGTASQATQDGEGDNNLIKATYVTTSEGLTPITRVAFFNIPAHAFCS